MSVTVVVVMVDSGGRLSGLVYGLGAEVRVVNGALSVGEAVVMGWSIKHEKCSDVRLGKLGVGFLSTN